MNDTQKRIKAYQSALPGLRERVVAVGLLLVMSIVMMTSASFAWLTISRAPAVTGVNTNVAANGSLEIALVGSDGSQPGESQVGDSSASEGQSVTNANLTWGNLINLSDSSYGLENLTLRPAQLNTAALLSSPLYGAVYNNDGRITQLTSNFGYTTWNLPKGDKPGYFGVSDNYGVRAISSTKMEAVGAEITYYNMVTSTKDKNLEAVSLYTSLGSNDKYMPSLATMMGLYMTARMNPSDATLSNPTCAMEDVENLRDMYAAFLTAFDAEAEAMALLANLHLFLIHGEGNYAPYTKEMIYSTTSAELKGKGIQITDLEQFIKDRNTIASDYEKLVTLCSSGVDLVWEDSGLNDIVNNLVNVGACTIGADNTPISSIGASNAMGYLSGTQEARITNGILYRFEERTGGYIEVKNLGISATVKRSGLTVPATVKANISTTASRDYNLFSNDLAHAEGLNNGDYVGGELVANDTYGLAIDLWVRTNAQGSYLILEGNVLTRTDMVKATGTDANGNEVNLYTVTQTVEDEEGNSTSYTVDLYKVETTTTAEDGTETTTTTWYDATSHTAITEEELNGAEPIEKMVEVETVLGYEGVNRIWKDNSTLSTDSTTQGSGSCYVYYADTPEDQARSLSLLEAFNVAFVDGEGRLMSTARMDTEHYYADNGRVTVPLVLNTSNSINLGEDVQGNVTYAITELEKNTPTRITAIVYLDGTKLTNDEVLAAADIQGQLNIQFGSSLDMEAVSNEKLEDATLSVSASLDKTSFDYDTATDPMTTRVTLSVDAEEQPNTVTAFFLRSINASQGSREQIMTFTNTDGGTWVADYTFKVPGNYVLRTVQLDGQEYVLDETPKVTISGFTVDYLRCTQAEDKHISIMTADNSSTVDLQLKFATNDTSKLPKTVQGRFLNDEDGSAVNINFTLNPTTQVWTGKATFLSSGSYTMQYLVLDGEYSELDATQWQTATVYLGMKVAVYTTSPHSFKYAPSEMADNEKMLGIQVKIMDNTGNEMPGLSDAKLTYGMKGSGVKVMDTDLTWDGAYYVGELTTAGPGIWQFSNVLVGSNIITNATTSPTFTIMSPEPPEYYAHNTAAYQYKPNNDAVMDVQITNSAAAQVQALIVKAGETDGTWVQGTIGGDFETEEGKPVNYWSFKVPTDANGYQDGNWQLTQLKLWDVFAADGTAYTEESPMEIDVSNTNNVTKVVSRVFVTFTEDKSQNFGKDANGNVTGAFMESYTISGLSVDIKDFEGEKLASDVQLTFAYVNGTSATYGGYTSDSLNNAAEGATITVPLAVDSTGTHFAQTEDKTILYAGNYTTTFTFKINGSSATDASKGVVLRGEIPTFTVSSVTPKVKITEAYYGSKDNNTKIPSSFTDTSVTVYATEYETTSTVCGQTFKYKAYVQPHVTITLSGYGNATGASMEFVTDKADGKVHLYEKEEGSTAVSTYTWSGNGACKRWVGYWNSQTGDDDRTTAGTLTATTLVLTYGNTEYNVSVPFTIKNPN